jgi:tetratricopeptide (TPR) repeat protein
LDSTLTGLPFKGHTKGVISVAFSPDGLSIVSGSRDNTIRMWNLDGTPIGLPFIGHTETVTSVAFSPDGLSIASGSNEYRVSLWKQIGWRSWLCTCLQRLNKNWNHDKNGIVYRTSLFEEGYSLAEQGQIELAIDRFKQALQTGKNVMMAEGDETPSSEEIEASAKRLVSPILLQQGRYLARNGNYNAALAKFEQAKQLDSGSTLNPEAEAKRLTAPILKMQGTFAALDVRISEAIAKFEQALQYGFALEFEPEVEAKRLAAPVLVERGKVIVKNGQVEEALDSYKLAQNYGPTLEISAANWNSLLSDGSLHAAIQKKPKLIKGLLEVSQKALENYSEDHNYRNTLGVAKVLAGGKLRWKSAIKDFEFYIEKTDSADDKAQRQRWIAALKEGQNPLTEDEIKALLDQ